MDAESGDLFPGADSWQLDAPFSCSELVDSKYEKPLQDWAGDPDCKLNDSESEDVLHGVDPNEVFPSGPPADPSSESDSGISEEPVADRPVATVTMATTQSAPATIYQVVYDISGLGGAETEPGQENVISIELDGWSSRVLLSDSCIVNELPVVSAAHLDPPSPDADPLYPDLQLTEEEQKLLTQEGVSLPSNLPLTKAEERILKKVRRKIRNKQSAQDSRRRRKDYIDELENRSLLTQLRQLQSLIKRTVSKGAQTSTCLLIILVSLGLIIMPSFSPFSRSSSADDDDYRPTGVISRNILTDPSSQPTADEVDGPADSPPPSDVMQSEPPEGATVLQEPAERPEDSASDVSTRDGSQSGNGSAVVDPAARTGGRDPTKPGHADEM
ncbi:cyclic AMP-responsive element-binding protein 3-like protein 4 isoform X3 [Embiotoca jacksoni]|uniref:cyclic AMP-responsive element-binding protein 3-like protein 4 isoform X3 n=1 Tax=Embiotoca jacksoni TaxID=100190 RepID=UPI003703ABA7